MADMFQVLCGFAAVFLALYYYYTSTFDFWKDRNVRGPRPIAFIGNFAKLLFKRKSISEQVAEWYKEYKDEPVFGLYEGRSPVLVINDLDMVKSVLIGEFSQFVNRGFRIFPEIERLSQHLFTLEAERWRPLRAKLSPVFTSGKLKEMFPLMLECSENLNKHLGERTKTCDIFDCKELAAKFTTDVIGSCVFGISMNALSDEESEFRRMGKAMFTATPRTLLRDAVRQFTPALYGLIGGHLQSVETEQFFINVITDTIKYRREHKVVRPDFIHMLMELQDHPEKIDNIEMTNTMLTAQAFVFFAAGFETSSSTISHALYELAQNQDIQEKLRQEIKNAYGESNKALTYDQIKELKYLDKVFKETLRKYPLLSALTRQAMKDYTFKGTKLSIPKNTVVWIPVYGLQNDPNLYPKPDVFDPERFNEDIFATRHPMSYLPFGDGPRNCIGARFANYQSKLGVISIIRDYKTSGEMAYYFEVLCAVMALIIGAYYYLLWTYNFWKRRGVLGPTPKFFSGNTKELLLRKISLPRFLERLYYEYKNEPVIGIYFGMKPVAILRDPELVREVLVTKFSKFSDRNLGLYEKTEPMSTNLVNLEVERWRPLRGKLATAFTQSKIKETFSLILECSKQFETRLEKIATQGGPMNCTRLTGDFVVDATSSYSFGIDAGALENGDSQMRKKKTELFEPNWENRIRYQMREYLPALYRLVGYVIAEKRFTPFFTKLFKDVSSEREEKHIQRPDLIDVLMKIKQHPEHMPNTEVTDTFLAAQMTLFFGASVESSANTLCGALLQLAIHQDVQDKLRQEIREYCGESTGDITFEAIKNMSYLDKVLKETLRMYPALMKLQRRTIAEHTFKGTNVTIPVGTEVWVPQFSLQRDADVYSNPDVFDPERFNPEAIAKRHPMHYIPFGDGPRNCIGLRFAIYQTKLGLVTIIRKYKVDVCDKTFLANEFSVHTLFLTIAEPIYLNVTKVED